MVTIKDTSNTGWLSFKSFESIAAAIGLICALLGWFLEYARGRFGWVTTNIIFSNEFTFIGYPLFLITAGFLPYLLGMAIFLRGVAIYRKFLKRLQTCIGLALVIAALPQLIPSIIFPQGAFIVGYADRVKSQINVPVLQQWAVHTISQSRKDQFSNVKERPQGITSFSYVWADISPKADETQSYIRLMDGGHYIGYYGLVIGGMSFRCKDADINPNVIVEYAVIAPGVCVFSGPDE